MKRILVLAAAVLAVACADKAPGRYAGYIEDATMNTVAVRNPNTEAVRLFTTDGCDMTEANGLLAGAPVVVEYAGELAETTPALKVSADATYTAAVGRWTMPDPIAPDSVMGVELQVCGRAASINMATLVYTGWEVTEEPGRILLRGQSIGNGQTLDFEERALIGRNAEGAATLTIGETGTVLTRE